MTVLGEKVDVIILDPQLFSAFAREKTVHGENDWGGRKEKKPGAGVDQCSTLGDHAWSDGSC